VSDQGSAKDNRLPCGASLSSKVLHKARLRLDQQNTKDAPPRPKATLFAAIGGDPRILLCLCLFCCHPAGISFFIFARIIGTK
jgi:hypothetical protein